ncbi:MAG TPA: laccase domain-containing protein [Verrucomicrobiae bacterium]|nr:laccase domain-containing protein [Verrucomicrobiae bacterium]
MEEKLELFPALQAAGWIQHVFTTRGCTPALVRHAGEEALLAALPIAGREWRFAEQVHGNGVALVGRSSPRVTPGVDALCTGEAGVVLGVSVADCCAVFVVDAARRAIGLAHSGRRGTELNVLGALVGEMGRAFGTRPGDVLVQLSPCIRPPHYDVDFAAMIRRQAEELGVAACHDCGVCTASRLDRYYSYRAEKGNTGRMLAALGIL